MSTPIKYYTEEGKWVGTEYYGFGFTTVQCVNRCETYAKVEGMTVTAVRPDGFSCGFHAPPEKQS